MVKCQLLIHRDLSSGDIGTIFHLHSQCRELCPSRMVPPSSHDWSSPCIRRGNTWEVSDWDRCSRRPVPHTRSLVAPYRSRIIDDHRHPGDWSAYKFQLQRRSRVVYNWMRLTS